MAERLYALIWAFVFGSLIGVLVGLEIAKRGVRATGGTQADSGENNRG